MKLTIISHSRHAHGKSRTYWTTQEVARRAGISERVLWLARIRPKLQMKHFGLAQNTRLWTPRQAARFIADRKNYQEKKQRKIPALAVLKKSPGWEVLTERERRILAIFSSKGYSIRKTARVVGVKKGVAERSTHRALWLCGWDLSGNQAIKNIGGKEAQTWLQIGKRRATAIRKWLSGDRQHPWQLEEPAWGRRRISPNS